MRCGMGRAFYFYRISWRQLERVSAQQIDSDNLYTSEKFITPPSSLPSHRGGVITKKVRLEIGGETNHFRKKELVFLCLSLSLCFIFKIELL